MDENKEILSLIRELKEIRNGCPYFSEKELRLPSRAGTERFIYDLQSIFFPSIFPYDTVEAAHRIRSFISEITECDAVAFLRSLPDIKRKLLTDISAIYEGDPAATSAEEIILAYPGFFATAVYRIAHRLYLNKVPYLPRLMSEIAHEKTGIDIHPGAEIGEFFCIDHGTGAVIGETARIGDRVKIYQGVTIGAKSFETDSEGRLIKGGKRHPDIGNDCIIYANATILGGNTKIGDGCIIGGNVWLTHSTSAGQRVYYEK